MKVYIIRHGESVNNVQHKWTGWMDVDLTEKGIEDAVRVRKILEGKVFDKVYASDLKRAIDTAKTALPGYEIETNFLLREIDVGSLAGTPLDTSTFTEEEMKHYSTTAFKHWGGESLPEYNERIKKFKVLLEKSNYESVAIFAHGGWQMSMLDTILGLYFPRKTVFFGNCAVMEVEYTGEYWRMVGLTNLD